MAMAGQHTDEWDCNGVLKTMISLMATKTTINKKYDERRVDEILLPPAMLLRAQENWRRTTVNGYQQWRRCSIGR